MRGLALACVLLCGCGADAFVAPDGGDAASDGPAPCPQGEIDCGGHCADLSTDSANCGKCGAVCGADDAGASSCMSGVCVRSMRETSCLALDGNDVFWTNGRGADAGGAVYRIAHGLDGGAPSLVAGDQESPHGVAADGNQVYWTTGGSGFGTDMGEVYRAKTDGSQATLVADSSSGAALPGPVAVAGGTIYWGNQKDETIWSAPTSGGTQKPLGPASGVPIFFSTTPAAIYWTAQPTNVSLAPSIERYKFGDVSTSNAFFTGQPGQVFGGLVVAANDASSFLALFSEKEVTAGNFNVTGPTVVVASGTPAWGITVTGDGATSYWTERVSGGRIVRFDNATKQMTPLATDEFPNCIAIDADFVYWTAAGRLTPGVAPR